MSAKAETTRKRKRDDVIDKLCEMCGASILKDPDEDPRMCGKCGKHLRAKEEKKKPKEVVDVDSSSDDDDTYDDEVVKEEIAKGVRCPRCLGATPCGTCSACSWEVEAAKKRKECGCAGGKPGHVYTMWAASDDDDDIFVVKCRKCESVYKIDSDFEFRAISHGEVSDCQEPK
jgi:DNA-directed RNA polymerase subunit M/transcription elongation factor TFIIS